MNRAEPTQIGPYRILRRIGEGGMGIVYEAENPQIERRVAIKCLNTDYASDPEAMQRFFNEARAANRINHPSIVQVSDSGTTPDGRPFIVMEFLAGQTLSARLQPGVALPLAGLLPIAWQIADALVAAHEKEIVHRDICIIYSVSLRKPQKTIQRRRRDDVDASSEWKSHILDAASH